MTKIPYLLCFAEGLLTFVSPCILPLFPVYIFYLAGVTDKTQIRRSRLVSNSMAFVIGFGIVFVGLGATATFIGSFLQEHILVMRKVSGIIMIFLGLNFIGILNLNFLNTDKHLEYNPAGLNFMKSLIFGMVFAFGWTPCVGAFLGSALLLASNADSIGQGVFMLLLFSAGLGLPFILFAALFNRTHSLLEYMHKYNRTISIVSGLVLIIAGLLVYTDKLGYLTLGMS